MFVSQGDGLGRVPEILLEGGLDHVAVGGIEPLVGVSEAASQHAVGRMHVLLTERSEAEHLSAEFRKRAAGKGHLDAAERRAGRLGGEARAGNGYFLFDQRQVLFDPDAGIDVERAEGIVAVEDSAGAAVPEVGEVEDGVDRRRSVASRHLPDVNAADVEQGIGVR